MIRRLLTPLVVLLMLVISVTAVGDMKMVGHMKPLPDELLASPIHLRCGVTITEWHGQSQPSPAYVDRLDKLCSAALVHFQPFLKTQHLTAAPFNRLHWSFALLPDGYDYRCINDTQFRFAHRFVMGAVWGYTDHDRQYSFTVSYMHMHNPSYAKVFTHELFHAMSMYSGLYEQHGSDNFTRTQVDERLAHRWTAYMGYGR